MSAPTSTQFDPDQHRNQHYVPQFWQKRFAGANNVLYRLKNSIVEPANPKRQMSGDWINTKFDAQGMATNALEFAFGALERQASVLFRGLDVPGNVGTFEEQVQLGRFIAISVCRHPDTMGMGHRRAKDLAFALADVHAKSQPDFCDEMVKFGMVRQDAAVVYSLCLQIPAAELLKQAEEVEYLSPMDPLLPEQIAVAPETVDRVYLVLSTMEVTVLDAPVSDPFVLGDTPFPPELGQGFVVPLGAWIALNWRPSTQKLLPWKRRAATKAEVEIANRHQFENAKEIMIGPSQASLAPYLPPKK